MKSSIFACGRDVKYLSFSYSAELKRLVINQTCSIPTVITHQSSSSSSRLGALLLYRYKCSFINSYSTTPFGQAVINIYEITVAGNNYR